MNQTTCPYVKISDSQVQAKSQLLALADFSLTSTAHAQGVQNSSAQQVAQNVGSSISDQLTIPFYLVLAAYFAFILLMSVVYVYHWFKFGLQNPYIKTFIPIYFGVIVVLTIPILFNLIY
jgi:hypothetical protein